LPTSYKSKDDYLEASYKVKEENEEKGMEIAKVNPELFRELQYMVTVSPDVLSPRSEDLERAYDLELFDRMIQAPTVFDPEETAKLLLRSNPSTKKDPDNFLAKKPTPGMLPAPDMPGAANSPLNALGGGKGLPQSPTNTPLASLTA
jgi:hypothetical protein